MSATSLVIMCKGTKGKHQMDNSMEFFAIAYNLAMNKRILIVTLLYIYQAYKLILSLILSENLLRKTIPVTSVGRIFTVVPRVEVYLDVGNSTSDDVL